MPRKWVSSGCDDGAVWGECQGSGAKPYQVQVDLAEPAFKCSCPSRKFPCKHGIGLMLIYVADQLVAASRPAWVTEWFAGRVERAAKKQAKAEAPPKPVDEAAQAKRREKRFERVADGLASLKLWAEDQIRAGIATAPGRGYAFFDEPARRMVDAQAPGAARRLQSLAAIAASGAGWQRQFMEELASLYLLILSYERLDTLSESTREDVLAALGMPRSQEEVLALQPVRDRWQIIAQELTTEDRLRVQRTWLYGTIAKRPALVLSFAHGSLPFDTTLPPGFVFEGDLCFYPGNGIRASLKSRQDPSPVAKMEGLESLDEFFAVASDWRARQPWTDEIALPVRLIVPVRQDGAWVLIDRDRRSWPASIKESAGWTMLAVSGGHPVEMVLSSEGAHVRPLAVLGDGQYISLVGGLETEAAA